MMGDLSKKAKHLPAFIKANSKFIPTLAYASLFHKLYPALKWLTQPKYEVVIQLPNLENFSGIPFQGFGTSLCWWANGISAASAEVYSNLFFGLDIVETNSEFGALPGLGMEVVRYNIGGCGLSTDPQNHPEYFPEIRRIEGFWINPENNDPESWIWSRDENQRRILTLAYQRCAKTVEFFCNAPMYWMTEESSSAGGVLLEKHYKDFAFYAVSVLQKSAKDWGIVPHSISLFNEPDAAWWFWNQTGQEGLNLKRKNQLQLLELLKQELEKAGSQTIIAASDENSVFNAIHSFRYLKRRNAPISQYNLHGYFMLAPQQNVRARKILRRNCGNLPIWVSEFGNWHDGIPLALQIFKDLKYLKPTAWVYWQSIDHGGWGLLDVDFNSGCRLTAVNKKYFVFAHFSRFIRAGDMLIEVDSTFPCIAAIDRTGNELKLVIVNESIDRKIKLDLTGVGVSVNSEFLAITTIIQGGPDANFLESRGTVNVGFVELFIKADSIISIRLSLKSF